MTPDELYCQARVRIFGFSKGHDWKRFRGTTFMVCRRCEESGYEMPVNDKETARA